ncbi:MAG: hypothetical protein ACYC69_14485 [Thermodesulfovibrionales bacterium]
MNSDRKLLGIIGTVITGISLFLGWLAGEVESHLIMNHFLIGMLGIFCCAPAVVFRRSGKLDVFEPIVLIPAAFFLYHGIGYYFYQLRVSSDLVPDYISDDTIKLGLSMALLGIGMFYCGYYGMRTISGNQQSHANRVTIIGSERHLFIYIAVSVIFFSFVNYLMWRLAGGIPIAIENYYKEAKTELMAGMGYLEFVAISVVPITLLALSSYWRMHGRVSLALKISVSFLYVFTLGILLMNVMRGTFLIFILLSLINYHYIRRQFTVKGVVAAFLILVLLAGYGGYLRSKQWTDEEWTIVNILLLETFVEFDNYLRTLQSVPEGIELQYGKTLLPLVTTPIPRALFPGKDEFRPAQVMFKEYMGYEHLRIGARLTLQGELFMNLHFFGVALGMLLYGAAASIVRSRLYPEDKNPLTVVVYSVTLIQGLVPQIPGDIASVTLGYIEFMLPILFLVFLAVLRKGAVTRHDAH